MKHLYLPLLFIVSPAFAVYTENIPDACGTTSSEFLAIYEPIQQTCDDGSFLPANSLTCVSCPSDHTCSGGTYDFNPKKSQGIVYNKLTETSVKSCSSNISHKLTAIYMPNTLTLNWDYKDGRTAQTTCIYDTMLVLPPDPVRPGYIFGGWRVKTPQTE